MEWKASYFLVVVVVLVSGEIYSSHFFIFLFIINMVLFCVSSEWMCSTLFWEGTTNKEYKKEFPYTMPRFQQLCLFMQTLKALNLSLSLSLPLSFTFSLSFALFVWSNPENYHRTRYLAYNIPLYSAFISSHNFIWMRKP